MKKVIPVALITLLLGGALLFGIHTTAAEGSAQDKALEGLDISAGAEGAGFEVDTNVPIVIGRVIGYLLSFLSLAMLIIVLYAGITWMTAGGTAKKVEEAKTMITSAIIGLAICLIAYAFTFYIVSQLSSAATLNEVAWLITPWLKMV